MYPSKNRIDTLRIVEPCVYHLSGEVTSLLLLLLLLLMMMMMMVVVVVMVVMMWLTA